jgi:hypothetical protein
MISSTVERWMWDTAIARAWEYRIKDLGSGPHRGGIPDVSTRPWIFGSRK